MLQTSPTYKILIVDDNSTNIDLIISILNRANYLTAYAQTGKTGIAKAMATRYDLILLDVMMPGMDGFEVCRILKTEELTKDIPVIFLTAKADRESLVQGFKEGAVDYVTKPFKTDELLARVRTHVELKRSKETLRHELSQRQKVENELKRSKANIDAIFENTSDPIFSINTHKNFVTFNTATVAFFRDNFNVNVREDGNLLFSLAEEHRSWWQLQIKKALIGDRFKIEYSIEPPSRGGTKFFEIAFNPIYVNQLLLGVSLIIRDVTQRKHIERKLVNHQDHLEKQVKQRTSELEKLNVQLQLEVQERRMAEEELRASKEELARINRNLEDRVKLEVEKSREKDQLMSMQARHAAMGEMIGNIAHQWRQPLNTIGIVVQDFLEAYRYDEFTEEYLEKNVTDLMDVITYMSQTIDDFRNFFKTEKETRQFAANEFVNRAITLVGPSFRNNHIEVKAELDHDALLMGRPNEFSQAVLNILNNAKDVILDKKIPRGVVVVQSAIDEQNGDYVLYISDNGGGIPEDIVNDIFTPYFTTKDQSQGTGIGLYMSKTIIEKNMNGHLTASNIVDGAKFKIQLKAS